MTIATRVLEMILPIEPDGDRVRAAQGPFRENEVPSKEPGGARARQQALVRASVSPRCALSRAPRAGEQAAESRRTMRARVLIKLI